MFYAIVLMSTLVIGQKPDAATKPAIKPPPPALKAPAAKPGPRGYVAHRRFGPVKIDGKLNEEAWELVPWSETFVDIEGDIRPRPRFTTRMKMIWDDKYLYVAADMQEPHVSGTLTKHDSVIFQDNDFEIFIDPNGDNHEYYEIEINALNTEWDLYLPKPYRDGGPALNEWEIPGLLTGVSVNGTINDPSDTDRGWSVEFAIPWEVLGKNARRKVPPEEGDQWRINFSRVEWKYDIIDGKYVKVPNTKEDNWVWSPQGVIDMHRPETWGYVQFTKRDTGTVKFQPDPTTPGRERLMRIYHAQKTYHAKNKKYTDSLEELGLNPKDRPPTVLKLTPDGFEAMVVVPLGIDKVVPLTLTADSKITQGEPQPAPSIGR